MDIYLRKDVLYVNVINIDYKSLIKKVKIIIDTYHVNNIEINVKEDNIKNKLNKFFEKFNNINVKYNLMC